MENKILKVDYDFREKEFEVIKEESGRTLLTGSFEKCWAFCKGYSMALGLGGHAAAYVTPNATNKQDEILNERYHYTISDTLDD